jgi:hypothetical protein
MDLATITATFPQWFQPILQAAWCLAALALPAGIIARTFRKPEVKALFASLAAAVQGLGKYLQKQTDDPIKFPRVAKAMRYIGMIHSYILAAYLFVLFLVILVLWQLATRPLTLADDALMVGYLASCVYMSAVLKAEGGRELVALRRNAAGNTAARQQKS